MTFLTLNRPMTEIPAILIAFRCLACGHGRGWQLKTGPHSFEYAGGHRQASVAAERSPLSGLVEIDEANLPQRAGPLAAGHDPVLRRQGSRQLRCAQHRRDRFFDLLVGWIALISDFR